MFRKTLIIMAMLFAILGPGAKAWGADETYSFTPDKTTSGNNSTSYVTDGCSFTYNGIGWYFNQWNPSSLQIKTNQSSAGSEFNFKNTSAFPGKIKSVVITFSALTVSDASKLCFVGGTSAISNLSGGTAGTWDSTAKTLTWTPADGTNYTYFAFYQNGKAASGTNNLATSNAIVITYEDSDTPSKTLVSIAISGTPDKITYETGESFDVTGLTVTGTYDDTSTADLTNDAEWTIDPATFTSTSQTSVSVTATVGDKTDTKNYNVTVSEHVVTPGAYDIVPNNTFWGNTQDGSVSVSKNTVFGPVTQNDITISMNSGNSTNSYINSFSCRVYNGYTFTIAVPSGFEITTIEFTGSTWVKPTANVGSIDDQNSKKWTGNAQTVTFTFSGTSYMTNIKVTFAAKKTLTEITVKNAPTKTTYYVGDEFDPAGLVITASYTDESTEDIAYTEDNKDAFSFSGFNSAAAVTNQEITVTYAEKSATFTVDIEEARTLTGIEVATAPTKTVYEVGEALDLTGLVVNGIFSKGDPEPVEYTANPADGTTLDVVGTTTVTLTSVDNTELTTSFDVTVNAIEGDRITLAETGVTGSSYAAWTSSYTAPSGAVYTGVNAGGNNAIQLRSDVSSSKPASGIISTTSGGLLQKVKVVWNTNTATDRELEVFGSNTAYTAVADLVDDTKKGTSLGKIKKDTSTELTITDEYEYVGVRSANGAMYLDNVTFIWSAPKVLESIVVKTDPSKVTYNAGEFFDPTGLVITATYDDESTKYIAYAGNESKFSFSPDLTTELTTANTSVTITYGDKSCDQAITVNPNILAAPTNLQATNVTSTSATLTWDVVIGASSYEVTLNSEVKTTETNSLLVENLTASTPYTWTVKAIGDNTTYADSETSESSNFTTPALPSVAYIVFFDGNNHGTPAEASITEAEAGAGITLPGCTPNSGYQFVGWATSETATEAEYEAGANYYPTANITLYAVYNRVYTITWIVNDTPLTEGGQTTSVVAGGGITTLPATPSDISEMKFQGWTATQIGTSSPAAPNDLFTYAEHAPEITDNTTFYAVFAKETKGEVTWNIANDIAANDVIIIATNKNYTDHDMKTAGTISSNIMSCKASTFNLGKTQITSVADGTLEFTLGGNSTSGWTLQNGTNYLGMSGDKKVALSSTSSTWTISISNGVATVSQNYNNKDYTLQYNYNNGNDRFTGYTSNQVAISLYKKTQGITYSNFCTKVNALSGDLSVAATVANTVYYISAAAYVPANATVTINGTLTNLNAANLVIEDGGQLIFNNAGGSKDNDINSGVKATVEKVMDKHGYWGKDGDNPKAGWYFLAAPMEDFAVASFISQAGDDGYDLYRWRIINGTPIWYNYKAHQNEFETEFVWGRGYLAAYQTNNLLKMQGTLNAGTEFNFSNELNGKDNFTLLGNPFTYDLNWNDFTTTNIYNNGFAVVDSNDGIIDYVVGNQIIKVGTGFMVYSEKDDATLSFTKGDGSESSKSNDILALNLFASNGNGEDNTIIVLDDKNGGFAKADNFNTNVPQIYTERLQTKYGIRNFNTNTKEFNVSFKAAGEGSNTIRLETIGEFDYVHLYDKLLDVDVDMLLEGSYTFEASEDDDTHRFIVRIDKGNTGIDENETENFVNVYNGEIHVSGIGEVQIFDVMGRMVHSEALSGDATISTGGFKGGVYVVRLIGNGWTKTEKIVVRR